VFDYQSLSNRSRELFTDLAKAGQIPEGKPEETPSTKGTFRLDGSKAEKELGLKCTLYYSQDAPSLHIDIAKEQMIKETMDQFIALGVVKA